MSGSMLVMLLFALPIFMVEMSSLFKISAATDLRVGSFLRFDKARHSKFDWINMIFL
jgi:hypothetical protein